MGRIKRVACWSLLLVGWSIAYGSELVLKSEGTRRAFLFDLYTCEIYAQAGTDMTTLLALDQPVDIRLTVHGEPPGSLPDGWAETIDAELNNKFMRKVNRAYRGLESGDRVLISYRDDAGTRVALNDETLFVDPGRGLLVAILDQWVGASPVSDDLKSELLNQ